jgi:hypothetical protein
LTASGSYVNGIKAQRRAVEIDDNFKEGWVHLAQVLIMSAYISSQGLVLAEFLRIFIPHLMSLVPRGY